MGRVRILGQPDDYSEYMDGEDARDYVHKDKIRDLIKWLENDQKRENSLYPDYWQEAIDKLKELLK
jgi:hypothetical protein